MESVMTLIPCLHRAQMFVRFLKIYCVLKGLSV